MAKNVALDEVADLLESVRSVANRLGCGMTDALAHVRRTVEGQPAPMRRSTDLISFVEGIQRIRMRRNDLLKVDIFRDPSWDMLLELYLAHARGEKTCVSALCCVAGAPATTAFRHIERLHRLKLITRHPDPRDHRRTFLALNPEVAPQIEAILERMRTC
jgi:DNA-binding MarR family transcriptional regulator